MVVSAQVRQVRTGRSRTATFQMRAAEDVTAIGEVQVRDEAVLGVDAVRKAFDCLVAALVDVSERVAADPACVDEIEGRDSLAGWYCDGPRGHGVRACECGGVRKREQAEDVYARE